MNAAAAYQTLRVLLPEILIILAATAMMTAGAFVKWPRRVWSIATLGVLVAALAALLWNWNEVVDPYAVPALNDALSKYARLGLLLAGFIVLGLAHDQVDDARAAEFFGSLLMIHAGSMLVAAANELVFLFAGLELVSVPTYVLLYLTRRNVVTQEAATKYFYLSIFSSGLLLFGMAYLYGLTGVSNLKALTYIVHRVPGMPQHEFGVIAAVFVMAGLGFRVAAVPFHFYAPDVYQGSPTVIAALLAWVPKGVGFVAMLRVLTVVLSGLASSSDRVADKAVVLSWVVAVATMTLGNTVALMQEDLKRLLAYSSIAHAGYLMIGITAAFRNVPGLEGAYLGAEGVVFYLATYALMTLGVFGIILMLGRPGRPVENVDDLSGLGRTEPLPAFAMALCLFSLAGVPPLAGFWGKFQVFAAVLSAGESEDMRMFRLLAVIGGLNAAIGAYYYLRIVVKMYLWPANAPRPEGRAPWPTALAVGVCAGLSLLLGLFPAPLSIAARQSGLAAVTLPEPQVSPPTAVEPPAVADAQPVR